MRILASFMFTCTLLAAFPQSAEAIKDFAAGDRVLVAGRLHRKCVARVSSIPSPGFAQLTFDRAGCGDSAQAYETKNLQHLNFVDEYKGLHTGDLVVANGHFSSQCGGKAKEITRAGYVSVDFDSNFCADTEGLYKASDLKPVKLVTEATHEKNKFEVGQKVTAKGILEQDKCAGEIRQLTDNGLASIHFEGLTCANAGRLFPLSELTPVRAVKARVRASAEGIFNRVMREIASAKKKPKKQARK